VNEDEGMRIFFEIHQDNPQEGPGDFASTRRAFSLLQDLPPLPHILDAGCGPGRQTFDLCRLTKGKIVAVDFHKPYVDALQRKSKALGLTQQITALQGDMANLQFQPQTFDVIWSEGAIYNIGFKAGLKMWKPLLKKGGYVAVTEVAWLSSDAPDKLKAFWDSEYPQIQDAAGNIANLRAAGYQPVANFTLPESAWWDYYRAIEKRVKLMKETYKNNSAALEVLETETQEIDLYRKYSKYYGYVFFIAQAL
jgi:ubiquinone/menaquinone biosynthesis C-methylase UbiE